MNKIIIILLIGLFTQVLDAQSIRKPWEEFTDQERTDYVNAINALSTADVQNLATEHARLSNLGIHTNSQFLPWHRIFLEYFEGLIKDQNPYVSIPYWDWHDSWSSSSLLFKNSSGSNIGILGHNVNGAVWEDPNDGNIFNRDFTSESQPSDSYKNATTFSSFTNSVQGGAHNAGHRFVGGDMLTGRSPIDPVFYIHHAMVDKAWSDWFNANPSASISILDNNMDTFNGYPVATMNAETIVDPRSMGLFYADDGLAVLDEYSVSNDNMSSEKFCYKLTIEAKDDFTVPNGKDAELKSCKLVDLLPGFEAENGSVFEARIDGDCNFSTAAKLALNEKSIENIQQTKLQTYPNPINDFGNIDFSLEKDEIVSIALINATGQTVKTLLNTEHRNKGTHSIDLSTNDLPSGIYTCRLTTQNESITKKIIIIK